MKPTVQDGDHWLTGALVGRSTDADGSLFDAPTDPELMVEQTEGDSTGASDAADGTAVADGSTADPEGEPVGQQPSEADHDAGTTDRGHVDREGKTSDEQGAGASVTGDGARATDAEDGTEVSGDANAKDVPDDVRKYERFTKMDGAEYDRVNEFLRDRTYITAREWALARLCADFRTETGVEMTKIGENLPELVPFMTDTYTPQAVNQARASFEEKVHMAGATFLYGAMSGFFTADELDELMYEVTETAKFLLEVEGVDLAVAEELDAEDRVSSVMREVREASEELRSEEVDAPAD